VPEFAGISKFRYTSLRIGGEHVLGDLIQFDAAAAIKLLETGKVKAYLRISENAQTDIVIEQVSNLSNNPYVEDVTLLDEYSYKDFFYQLDKKEACVFVYSKNTADFTVRSMYILEELRKHVDAKLVVTDMLPFGSGLCDKDFSFVRDKTKPLYWYDPPDAEMRHFGRMVGTCLQVNHEGSFKSYFIEGLGVLFCQTCKDNTEVFVHSDFLIPDDTTLKDILMYASKAVGHTRYPCMPGRYLLGAVQSRSTPATPSKVARTWYSHAGLNINEASLKLHQFDDSLVTLKSVSLNTVNRVVDSIVGNTKPFASNEDVHVYRIGRDEYEHHVELPSEEFRDYAEYFAIKGKIKPLAIYVAVFIVKIKNQTTMLVYADPLVRFTVELGEIILGGVYALADSMGNIEKIHCNVSFKENAEVLVSPRYKVFSFLDMTGNRNIYNL